ncbi:MAG: hypothetical protein NVSMB2_06080 [Chloroflexota bacterium]
MPEILSLIADARRAAVDHQFERASALASEILERLPACLTALRILAWAQLELGSDAASATFARCAVLDPEDTLAYVGQAIWLEQRGERSAAGAMWTRAWELDPDNQAIRRAVVKLTGDLPESSLADAVSLLRVGRNGEAVGLLRTLHKENPEVLISLLLVTALWMTGAHHDAFELATAIHAQEPLTVKAALFVGAREDRAGRTLRSRDALARAEQVDPGLTLFAPAVRQVGLQPALDLHRATRTPIAAAR